MGLFYPWFSREQEHTTSTVQSKRQSTKVCFKKRGLYDFAAIETKKPNFTTFF
ncbi:hypothetical protein M634_01150 [Vibrio parahaemolyticus O1:Kuk str. FDA_R31]|nr:hypothetical protein M634_01150 [Vibrio parahaemolyticus O1:Kuk str. FDA_R31]EXJ36492.1 hypothetical protein D049_5284 [Vibrio parahaemolyticus VPTS-2010]KIT43729.1 hypothetical protein H331_22010 [Vibrio parahaemolyticus 3644]